ncbi:PAS domain S-box protein [Candidatus Omnitrophota bacterium]
MRSIKLNMFIMPLLVFNIAGLSALDVQGQVLKVRGSVSSPPFIFMNNNKPDGFFVDYINEISDVTTLEIDVDLMDWSSVLATVKSGDTDIILDMYYSEERDKYVDFTIPVLNVYYSIFTRKNTFISSWEDIEDKEIIVMRNDIMHETVITEGIGKHVIVVESSIEGLLLLSSGKHDCFLGGRIPGLITIKKFNLDNLRTAGAPGYPQESHFAVQEGNTELVNVLNEGILMLQQSGRFAEIHKKWFSDIIQKSQFNIPIMKYVFIILLPFLAIIAIMGLWSWSLRRTVNSRTEALRESEELLRKMADNYPNSYISIIEKDYTIGFTGGREFKKQYLDSKQFVGFTLKQVFGDQSAFVREHYEKTFNGEECSFELFIYNQHQSYHTVPLQSEDGSIPRILVVVENITERKEAEEALRNEKERAQLYLDVAGVMFVLLDTTGCVTLVNRMGCEILGYEEDMLIGKDWFETCLPLEQRSPVKKVFIQLINGIIEPVEYYENTVVTRNGNERIIAWHNSAITNDNGTIIGILSSGVDITERKQAEEEREKLETQIQHAQKLESLGVLAGGIAHDFNNLLVVILGNAELALMGMTPESPTRKSLEEIKNASVRASELTKQMLAYSGKGKFVVETIDINRLIDEMGHMLDVSISKKAVLKYTFDNNLPAISADATQIRQIVMNLIVNASEAIGDKSGIITINTGLIDTKRDYLSELMTKEELPEGYYVFIEVSDTGCGMDDEAKEKLFDPFYTTKFTGRGLGLSAVHGIVRGHHGAIKVYSESGKGSTFKVFLPCPELSLKEKGKTKETEQQELTAKGTILVVDDEESVRAYACRVLEMLGFVVLSAKDGREGVELFSKYKDDITVVLLDMTMPHMDGKEAFSEMKRIKPDVSVILSSGYNEQEATSYFAGKGLAGFIQKPYQLDKLIAILSKALDG